MDKEDFLCGEVLMHVKKHKSGKIIETENT